MKTYICGIIESKPLVKSTDRVQLALIHIKFRNLQVLLQTFLVVALGDNSQPSLRSPSQQDLRRSLVVLLRNGSNSRVFKQNRCILSLLPFKLNERLWTERRIRSNRNFLALSKLEQCRLDKIRVVLNLQSRRSDLGVSQQIQNQASLKVGDTNRLRKTLVYQALHRSPSLLNGSIAQLDIIFAIVCPARRIASLGIDVLECNREVDDEEIEIVDAPVCELLFADWLYFVAVVEGVPELADDEEVFAFDEAIFDCSCYAFAGFFLIAVICIILSAWEFCSGSWRHTACSVEQSVAGLDCIVYGIRTCCVVDLPQTEAHLWHSMTAIELDRWRCHGCRCVEPNWHSLRL